MLRRSLGAVADLWRFVVDVALRWYHGGVGDLAAGVTFWILVSLPASILALLSVLSVLENAIDASFSIEIEANVIDFMARVFTDDEIVDTVGSLFNQSPNSGLLTASVALTLWSVSRGFAGLIRALDDIYEVVDGRSWYHTRVVAVVLGVGSLLISVPLVILERLVWGTIPDGTIERSLRSVVALALLASWAATIYHYGPAARSRWRHDLPGAFVAAAGWWLLTSGFGFYEDVTSRANDVTAAVGALLLALTWIWLAAQVLLIGATVNLLYGKRRDIARNRPSWSERIARGTGEIRRIVVTDAEGAGGRPDGLASASAAGSLGPDRAPATGEAIDGRTVGHRPTRVRQ